MDSLPALATAHLMLRLQPLHRALRAAAERQRLVATMLTRPDLAPLCVTEEQIEILLDQVSANGSGNACLGVPARLTAAECVVETDLRTQSAALGFTLPLDRMVTALRLSAFEVETVLLCAAPELDRAYERIYAFILDDLNRRYPCVELLTALTATSIEERVRQRHALTGSGRLRRRRVISPFGDAPTDLRQEFRLNQDVFAFLTGADVDLEWLCRDRLEIEGSAETEPPSQITNSQFSHLSDALRSGEILFLGIWGPRQNGSEELVLSLAAALQRPLRRVAILDLDQGANADPAHGLIEQLKVASTLQACLWLDSDPLFEPGHERLQRMAAEVFAASPAPIFITGENPWRPTSLVRSGSYAEIELGEPASQARERLWSRSLPELELAKVKDLAARYQLAGADIHCVSGLARTRARLAGNGKEPVVDHIAAACAVVTRRWTSRFATIVTPRRGPDDLILPANLHQQIMEVATFFRLSQHVDQVWGFGRLSSGSGMKVLFTGDPGTGKTLAAEIIAGLVELPLYKVDLARIVSKWVGETEKNLEAVFREAEESHAVLFFDEAEALFGKRAEIQHGTDRYANLEVSYLLQRLENSRGLVILASNLKDQIDAAFVRRFHVGVHFPRPGLAERRRIWQRAFPQSAPLDPEVNLDALARLDLTGAGIVGSARTAALIAANAGSTSIDMAHVIRATARQFRREARVLTPSELGAYGAMLQGAS
jgi:ATPase family associated with various cellular activities (AAA)